ncbi:HIT finger domain-containing protein [Histoplasma capsulatum H143]|uniref:HIT finger domain-containing protein n=1 Tax=Ajellomyces capsulatus (strain H143) TaxID=544712 RepID=C6HJK1_AJECH|nr:HIT finger domain-containing protein [Histoplasma capsulatum H143]
MSLNKIEILPTSSSHLTPGWAYVPDTRYGNSTDTGRATGRAAGARKRAVRDLGVIGRAEASSSRQNTATLRHIAELDRENHKDTYIPIPTKQKSAIAKDKPRGKTTSNVRRILLSQKTFKNYLDDEEAALAQAQSHSPAAGQPSSTTTAATARSTPLKSSKPSTPRTSSHPATATPNKTSSTTGQPSEPPNVASSRASTSTIQKPQPNQQLIASNYDNDPLLRSYIPSAPSERLMQLLLAEPPLSYNASLATVAPLDCGPGTPAVSKPPRHFCSICGYWGRVKCIKCRVRHNVVYKRRQWATVGRKFQGMTGL